MNRAGSCLQANINGQWRWQEIGGSGQSLGTTDVRHADEAVVGAVNGEHLLTSGA